MGSSSTAPTTTPAAVCSCSLSPWTRCSSWSLGCATSRRSLPCSCTSLRATPLLPLHRPCRRFHRCPPPRRVVSLFVFVAPLS
uniref:Uncharacterized protein n=1 Tax=Oryza glaberrima TaxID=4538 RepID=I1R378_ORYGL